MVNNQGVLLKEHVHLSMNDFAGLKYVLLSQNPRTLECVWCYLKVTIENFTITFHQSDIV